MDLSSRSSVYRQGTECLAHWHELDGIDVDMGWAGDRPVDGVGDVISR